MSRFPILKKLCPNGVGNDLVIRKYFLMTLPRFENRQENTPFFLTIFASGKVVRICVVPDTDRLCTNEPYGPTVIFTQQCNIDTMHQQQQPTATSNNTTNNNKQQHNKQQQSTTAIIYHSDVLINRLDNSVPLQRNDWPNCHLLVVNNNIIINNTRHT